jgi:ribosomal protein S27E
LNRNTARFGFDALGGTCLVLAALLAMIPFGAIVSLLLLAWALFRALSTNHAARSREALFFSNHTRGIRSWATTAFYQTRLWWRKLLERVTYWRSYKVFKCKNCGQKLRVPRGKGNLKVTCRNCKTVFPVKS